MNWFHCRFLWKCYFEVKTCPINSPLTTFGTNYLFPLWRSHWFKMKAVARRIIFEFKGLLLCLKSHTAKWGLFQSYQPVWGINRIWKHGLRLCQCDTPLANVLREYFFQFVSESRTIIYTCNLILMAFCFQLVPPSVCSKLYCDVWRRFCVFGNVSLGLNPVCLLWAASQTNNWTTVKQEYNRRH